jgi:hypothetical protein
VGFVIPRRELVSRKYIQVDLGVEEGLGKGFGLINKLKEKMTSVMKRFVTGRLSAVLLINTLIYVHYL